jgi:hypothetical protein
VRQVVVHELPASPESVFAWVEDLSLYPAWMPLVTRAVAEPAAEPSAWAVELTGRLGPLARSKRLRMARVRHDPPRSVRFERAERDGRSHSAWVLGAEVTPTDTGARLVVELVYDGGLFGPVLERLLADQVETGRRRLADAVSSGPPSGAAGSR